MKFDSVNSKLVQFIQSQLKKSCLAKKTDFIETCLRSNLPILSMHKATVERKKLPFSKKKLLAEPGSGSMPSSSTSWVLRGQERRNNKNHNTTTGLPAEKEKYKLMTTRMS